MADHQPELGCMDVVGSAVSSSGPSKVSGQCGNPVKHRTFGRYAQIGTFNSPSAPQRSARLPPTAGSPSAEREPRPSVLFQLGRSSSLNSPVFGSTRGISTLVGNSKAPHNWEVREHRKCETGGWQLSRAELVRLPLEKRGGTFPANFTGFLGAHIPDLKSFQQLSTDLTSRSRRKR